MDVVKHADWVLDLGPDGGEAGGHLMFQGTPEGLAVFEPSRTAPLRARRTRRRRASARDPRLTRALCYHFPGCDIRRRASVCPKWEQVNG